MKKIILLLLILFSFKFSFAQFVVSAGPTFIKAFAQNGAHVGFNLSAEYAIDDLSTYYARFIHSPNKRGESSTILVSGKDFSVNPFSIEVNSTEKMNYNIFEFGKRYYFGEGFESGFSFYGGSSFNIIFNKVSYEIDKFDETKYQTTFSSDDSGNIVSLGIGLNAGLKHMFNFGTLSFDTGLNYNLFGLPSNNMAGSSNMYSGLFFMFNFGFRKYIY
jgi:hypothetical protein